MLPRIKGRTTRSFEGPWAAYSHDDLRQTLGIGPEVEYLNGARVCPEPVMSCFEHMLSGPLSWAETVLSWYQGLRLNDPDSTKNLRLYPV